jgi:hypothetical protein
MEPSQPPDQTWQHEQTQINPSFPYITISGYSAFNGSGSGSFPKSNRIRTWQYGDNMSYTEGKHQIQFGGQLYYQRHAFYNGQSQEGQFAFTTKYSGDGFSDYLLGYPASVFVPIRWPFTATRHISG